MRDRATGSRPSYVSTEYGQVHIRTVGAGSPVVILHDAPGSSAGVDPSLVAQLAPHRAVVIPDLIGAGATTAEDNLASDLDVQADVLASALGTLGIRSTPLIGDGTGAAIALRLRERVPDLVTEIGVLSTPPASSHLATMPAASQPDVSGTHLISLFDDVRDSFAFSPWWHRSPQTRRRRGLPSPEALHAVFLDTAAHGTAHQHLVRSAVHHWEEKREEITQDVRFLGGDIGANVQAILTMTQGTGDLRPPDGVPGPGEIRMYASTSLGPVHLRLAGFEHSAARPIILLHANPGSGQSLEGLARELAKVRPVVAWDTPGHGRSTPLPTSEGPTMDGTYAPILLEVLDALGVERCDVYGTHTGAALATELSVLAPERVGGVVLDGVPLFDDHPDLVASVLENYFVDLTPDTHGSQIRRAWGATADMALWWPWFNHSLPGIRDTHPYSPELLHAVVLDMLRSAPHYERSYRAAWQWQATRRLPLVSQPVLVGSTPTDPLAAMTPRSLDLLKGRGTEVVFARLGDPNSVETNAAAILRFLAAVSD